MTRISLASRHCATAKASEDAEPPTGAGRRSSAPGARRSTDLRLVSAEAPNARKRPSLAAILAELRRSTGRTINDVAQAAGISRQHLWRIERALVQAPGAEVLESIARAYGLSLAQLLDPRLTSGRKETLSRLTDLAETIADEDWRTLDEISKRVFGNAVGVAGNRLPTES